MRKQPNKNIALKELIQKTAKDLNESENMVSNHVNGLFKFIEESMNRLEHEGYYLKGFCSFQIAKHKMIKATKSPYSLYVYLKKYNRNKLHSEWDWLLHKEEFVNMKNILLEEFGSEEAIHIGMKQILKQKNNERIKTLKTFKK